MFRYIVYRSRNYGIYYNRLAVDTPSTYRIFSNSIVQTITELLSNLLHRLLCELLPELLSELYTNYYPHEMLFELLPLLPELLSELLLELQLDPLPTKTAYPTNHITAENPSSKREHKTDSGYKARSTKRCGA